MSALSVLLLLFCGPAWAAPAGGSEFKSFRTREIDFYGQTRYYQAQGNFTKGGNSYDSLTSGYGYEIFNFDVGARAVLHSKWAAFAQATMANATSKSPTNTRTNSNLSEAQAGLDFLLNEGALTLIPEFSISFPFEDNSVTKDVVALSDGVMTVNGRAIALMRTRVINLGAYLGYTYREKGLSSLLPYGLLGEFPLGSFTLGADLRGYASLSSDSTSDTEITRDFYQCRTNGCAKRYYAMNPSLLESSAYFKWAVSRTWDVSAGFTMAITGQSTSTGYGAFANIGYRWGLPAAPTPMEDSETLPAGRARVVNPGFQEETNDGVDQNLFKAPPPPPSPDAQRKKRQKQIQDDLNKTEMQIELKSNRKKRSRP